MKIIEIIIIPRVRVRVSINNEENNDEVIEKKEKKKRRRQESIVRKKVSRQKQMEIRIESY